MAHARNRTRTPSTGGRSLSAIPMAWTLVPSRGLAVAYRRYSLKYVPNEEQAKAAKRGLWADTFEMPREYRARTFGGGNAQGVIPTDPGTCPPPPPDPRPPQCASGKGRPRIYHMPGSRTGEVC
jgi:hypothetical protein